MEIEELFATNNLLVRAWSMYDEVRCLQSSFSSATEATSLLCRGVPTDLYYQVGADEVLFLINARKVSIAHSLEIDAASEEHSFEGTDLSVLAGILQKKAAIAQGANIPYSEVLIDTPNYKSDAIEAIYIPHNILSGDRLLHNAIAFREMYKTRFGKELPFVIFKDAAEIVTKCENEEELVAFIRNPTDRVGMREAEQEGKQPLDIEAAKYIGRLSGILVDKIDHLENCYAVDGNNILIKVRISDIDVYRGIPLREAMLSYSDIDKLVGTNLSAEDLISLCSNGKEEGWNR